MRGPGGRCRAGVAVCVRAAVTGRPIVDQVGAGGARLVLAETPTGDVVVIVEASDQQAQITLGRLAAVGAAAAVMDRLTTLLGRTLP